MVERIEQPLNTQTLFSAALALAVSAAGGLAGPPAVTTAELPWQQVSAALDFTFIVERERYTSLDRSARLVFAVEAGRGGPGLESLSVDWSVAAGTQETVRGRAFLGQGLAVADLELAPLPPGRYDVTARLMSGGQALAERAAFFRVERVEPPARSGRVALVLPDGLPLSDGTFPVQTGVPFPKGALWDPAHVRLVDAQGRAVPCGVTVRSRWGSGDASIRWLGVDFQPGKTAAWWPARAAAPWFLEYGPAIKAPAPAVKVTAVEGADGIAVDSGAISFLVRRRGFNLLDSVKLNGKAVMTSDATHGLYLVDHEGTTYRAANDAGVKLTVEERNDLRVVIRAEGWYVKDGAVGSRQSATLPTDRLCRFITRIEAYAGKPYVRVLSTWINTFDTFSVRLRDLGMSLPLAARTATFGVEGGAPVPAKVPAGGVRLVQHLHDRFVVEDGAGKALADGERSGGWVVAQGDDAGLAISHRRTWQRFPKELEVLPDSVRLHVWPAHGKDHPEINPLAKDQIHRLWFAHQGRELDMRMPWGTYFAVSDYVSGDLNIKGKAEPQALTGIHTCGMGTAVTSDLLLHFSAAADAGALADTAACFQAAPHALADPKWICDSLALGYMHPYDPDTFRGFEEAVSDSMRGYWATQNAGAMFGMWIYRSWHHSAYNRDGSWMPYRLFVGSHHHEAILPWMFYARSGDPFYLTQGRDNIRQLSDVQISHHTDPDYERASALDPSKSKLVGATFHENSLSPWGGDFEVFGHQTCYNGLILGYYLTGDLRLREVLVDEWQNTMVADRANPAIRIPYGDAGSLQQGRDNSNPVSELLDLYQLTYDPRVLAVLAPRLDVWLHGSKTKGGSALFSFWGHPLHNVLLFRGGEDLGESLLELMAKNREGKAPPKSVKGQASSGPWASTGFVGDTNLVGRGRVAGQVWDFCDYSAEAYAMATILDPESPYAADILFGNSGARTLGQQLMRGEPKILYPVADQVRFLPRMMYALMHSTRRELAGVLGDAQPMPTTWLKTPLQVILREDQDQAIKVHITGLVRQTNGIGVQAFGPDGALISRTVVPPGRHSSFVITLPADGKTGPYVVFVERTQQGNDLSVPLTVLPEVFLVSGWGTEPGGTRQAQYFTRGPGGGPCEIAVGGETLKVVSPDKLTVLGFTDKVKKEDTVRIGPEGAWICANGAYKNAYAADGTPLIVAISPERWFQPAPESLALKPAPLE